MDLGIGEKQYRVLKCEGNVAEVLCMESVGKSAFDSNNTNTYAGSTLDTYLNSTWYNTLSAKAKSAIVVKNINQYQYSYSESAYNKSIHSSYANYSTKALKANVGERYVYALDIEDIEMYFGGTGGNVDNKTLGTFSSIDILQMFWNQTSIISEFPWLRSAGTDDSGGAWFVGGDGGYVDLTLAYSTYAVHAVFCINLTKIPFTKSV